MRGTPHVTICLLLLGIQGVYKRNQLYRRGLGYLVDELRTKAPARIEVPHEGLSRPPMWPYRATEAADAALAPAVSLLSVAD